MELPTETDVAVGNNGERMIVVNHFVYWAHLSIYRFALPMTAGRRVLDAGAGVGYGAAYLARRGATVLALDASAEAMARARQRYAGAPVTYEVADLDEPLPCGDQLFDTVFSSNVFEHVANVEGLAAECARVVKPDGTVIVAVPPIQSAATLESDMGNVFHLQHIPPTAWHAKLSRFFGEITCHGHYSTGRWAEPAIEQAEIAAPPEQTTIRETDFEFPAMTLEEWQIRFPITAIFVCRAPRATPLPETLAERTPLAWHEAAIAAKLISKERAEAAQLKAALTQEIRVVQQALEHEQIAKQALEAQIHRLRSAPERPAPVALSTDLAQLRTERSQYYPTAAQTADQLAAMLRSTSWRLTAPLRRLGRALGRH